MAQSEPDSDAQLELALDAAGMALWVWDVEANTLQWRGDVNNVLGRRQVTFHGAADELGQVAYPEDRDRLLRAFQRAVDHGEPYEIQYRQMTSERGIRWMLTKGRVHDAPNGRRIVLGSLQDITERKHDEELRARFLERVIAAEDAERRRIARELHDDMGQSLTSLLVGLGRLEDLASTEVGRQLAHDLREIASRSVVEVGRIARGLHPSVLDDLGFVPAVERYVADFGKAHSLGIDLHVTGLDARLPVAVETTLYRILQEALTNVAKHAEAETVSVIVERQNGTVRCIVEDDGRGFAVPQHGDLHGQTGVGLYSIRERVALLHGSASLESTPSVGTTLYVQIPLKANPAAVTTSTPSAAE